MKQTKLVFFYLLFFITNMFPQDIPDEIWSLSDIQGIWNATEYVKEPFPDVSNEFMIIKENMEIDFNAKDGSFSKSFIGFQDLSSENELPNDFTKDNLKSKGRFFTVLNSNGFVSIDGMFGYSSNQFFHFYTEYIRIEKLNNQEIIFLSRRGNKDRLDYLKLFLDKDIKLVKNKICVNKSVGIPTKMYLIKNHPVEILEEQSEWLRICYYPEKNGKWTGKTIEGWIKKSDVE